MFDVFTGSNAILIFLIVAILVFAFSELFKYAAAITLPILILLAIAYFGAGASDSNFYWLGFLSIIIAALSLIQTVSKNT